MKVPSLRPIALAALIANVGLIVTGAAVRLTDSGLGCPTWPRCTDSSYTTTSAMGVHGAIEFGNRLLTFVLGGIALACLVVALLDRPRRKRQVLLSGGLLLGIPGQGVVGGITVLTHLNPWVVGVHFLLSMALIVAAYALWRSTYEGDGPPIRLVAAPLRHLTALTVLASVAVIVLGVIVTGSGPHSGDNGAKRNGLDPASISQAHADLVFLLIGLTIALWFAFRAVGAHAPARAALTLFVVEMAQGLIGFVQYFTHLPVAVVAAHMLGSGLVWTATLAVRWSIRERPVLASPAAEVPAPVAQQPVPASARAQ